MTLLSLFTHFTRHGFETFKRERTRQHLLALNERALADLGFERELLEQGVDAYPWREVTVENPTVEEIIPQTHVQTPYEARLATVSRLAAMHY